MQQYNFKKIGTDEIEIIKKLFISVFTIDPWNDAWSDLKQLHMYLLDLIDQNNSLTYGLFENDELIGVSMGHIKHWYSGTEYHIDELCIKTSLQGRGIGTCFLKKIEETIKAMGVDQILLHTEINAPAYEFYLKKGYIELKNHVTFTKKI